MQCKNFPFESETGDPDGCLSSSPNPSRACRVHAVQVLPRCPPPPPPAAAPSLRPFAAFRHPPMYSSQCGGPEPTACPTAALATATLACLCAALAALSVSSGRVPEAFVAQHARVALPTPPLTTGVAHRVPAAQPHARPISDGAAQAAPLRGATAARAAAYQAPPAAPHAPTGSTPPLRAAAGLLLGLGAGLAAMGLWLARRGTRDPLLPLHSFAGAPRESRVALCVQTGERYDLPFEEPDAPAFRRFQRRRQQRAQEPPRRRDDEWEREAEADEDDGEAGAGFGTGRLRGSARDSETEGSWGDAQEGAGGGQWGDVVAKKSRVRQRRALEWSDDAEKNVAWRQVQWGAEEEEEPEWRRRSREVAWSGPWRGARRGRGKGRAAKAEQPRGRVAFERRAASDDDDDDDFDDDDEEEEPLAAKARVVDAGAEEQASFATLGACPALCAALTACGFTTPTGIQAAGFPVICEGVPL